MLKWVPELRDSSVGGLMRRVFTVCLLLAILVGWSTSSWAAVRISRINFDPAGLDSGTNAHLNGEWIVVKNAGSRAVQMRGWKILGRERAYVYRFASLLLRSGEKVKLHTGRGNDGAAACEAGESCVAALYDFYWNLDDYVWNNDADVARLRSPSGKLVDECSYSSAAGATAAVDLSDDDEATGC